MQLSRIFSFFVPKNNNFFVLFSKASNNLVEISQVFNEMINSGVDRRPELYKKIVDLEHVGDDITHQIFVELSTNFITPFDREDISFLASSLDDIADFVYAAAKRVNNYRIVEASDAMKKMAELIELSTKQVHVAVTSMHNLDNANKIREALVKINSLENHADDIFQFAILDLFDNEKDPVMIMKVREIFSKMETATDKCEDVANVIETIIIKNS